MSTVNPQAISRPEFDAMVERMASRLAALESNESRPPTLIDQEGRAQSGQSEVVTQNEFRLFKWLGAFVVAAVLGAFGVVYKQIGDMRIEMRDLHTTSLRELYAQIGSVRQDLGSEIDSVRENLGSQIRSEIGGLRQEMKANHGSILEEIGSLRERVVRVETLLVREKPRTES